MTETKAERAEHEREREANERTTRPSGATGVTGRGAHVEGQMGEPHSPTGPNEVDGDPSGVIPPAEQVPPGEDQPHLVGGDPGVPLTSQTGNPAMAESEAAKAKHKDADKDAAKPSPTTPHPAHTASKR